MGVDDLAPGVAKPSTPIVLIIYDMCILVFPEGEFSSSALYQC